MTDSAQPTATVPQKPNFFRRSRARNLTVKCLYQWLIDEGDTPAALVIDHVVGQKTSFDRDYLASAVHTIIQTPQTYRTLLDDFLDRPWSQLDPASHAVLLLASWELSERMDVPTRVILNEAIKLTKTYGANENAYRYVNVMLDRLAKVTRPAGI